MGPRIPACAGLAAMLFVSVPTIAHGQESTQAREEAQNRFAEGLQRARAGDYQGALSSFVEAYAVWHVPSVLFNQARCEEKLKLWVDARRHYGAVAEDGAASNEDRAEAKNRFEALSSRVGRVKIAAAPSTQVAIDDGSILGRVPLPDPIDVMPGRHTFAARLGSATRSLVVEVPAGATVTVNIEFAALQRTKSLPVPTRGPQPPERVNAGDNRPHLSVARVAVVSGLAAAAMGAFGGGVYFALASQSDGNNAANLRANQPNSACYQMTTALCTELDNTIQTQKQHTLWADTLYFASGVLATSAFATWFLWPAPKAPQPTTRLAPAFGQGVLGLTLAGSF